MKVTIRTTFNTVTISEEVTQSVHGFSVHTVHLSLGSVYTPLKKKWQSTPVFLPGESHGQRSLADYSPWGREEVSMTEQLHSSKLWLTGWTNP